MKKLILTLCFFDIFIGTVDAQQVPMCRTSEVMGELYKNNPQTVTERLAFEEFTKQYIQNRALKTTADSFVIPVVFHVYGTTQSGYTINDPLIKLALKGVNDDFNGLNSDFGTVHSSFMGTRGTIKFRFALAQKDPSGNATTGILYYPTKSGYGKTSVDAQIAADAWDNTKYMNVYIQNDLYDNAVYNNSGIAWYPNMSMTTAGTARVVYNGAYLATNNTVNPEFASVLTHEFAHFFNLIHTFEGGCVAPNDSLNDTPPCTTAQGCHSSSTASTPVNCNSQLINAENYMDYNTNCYKMFTQGQTTRMTAATQHPARITLWQESNLVATGIHLPTGVAAVVPEVMMQVYPNPSNGIFNVSVNGNYNYAAIYVTDITGSIVYNYSISPNKFITVDMQGYPKGLYFLTINTDGKKQKFKLALQ